MVVVVVGGWEAEGGEEEEEEEVRGILEAGRDVLVELVMAVVVVGCGEGEVVRGSLLVVDVGEVERGRLGIG